MRLMNYLLLLSLLGLCACGGGGNDPSATPATTRSFAMGFTPFPNNYSSDPTTAATILDNVYAKLGNDADLVAHHFDNGIPWNDAEADTFPYNDHIMSDWQARRDNTPAGDKIYVAITPINSSRTGLANLRDTADDMPLTPPFSGYAFNDSHVKTAYLNYCKQVITYFNPDYLAIGIEANLLRKNTNATTWAQYVELNHYVYTELKAQYPNLPIFVSVSPVEAIKDYTGATPEFADYFDPAAAYAASQLSAINDVLADSDDYAISLYPYMTVYYNSAIPTDMLDKLFALSNKPIVIAETGMLAKDLTINAGTVNQLTFTGSDSAQNDYMSLLLQKAEDYHVQFVTWFIQQDYDQLCAALGCTDFENLWRNTGVYDSSGTPRTSYTTWTQWRARPRQ